MSANLLDRDEAATLFSIGYWGAPDTLPETVRARELNQRIRRPLAEFVFTERWGETAPLVAKA
ncbi:MAG: hypothetical protein U0350_07605 [Caldilineaceae bacterium]